MKLDESGRITQEYLNEIDAHFTNSRYFFRRYRSYVIGENPAILESPTKEKPDNRVPIPFARKIVSTIKGYMAKPGYITYSSEDEAYQETVKEILDMNDEELETAELLADALTFGVSYEVHTIDEELNHKFYPISPMNGYMIYDDTLARNPIAFVHRETIGFGLKKEEVQTVYYPDIFIEYRRKQKDKKWTIEKEQEHPFGMVPAVEYKTDKEKLPVFKPVLPLIDEIDKIMSSDYADELERFANAYLLLMKRISSAVDENGMTDIDKLKKMRVFDDLGSIDGLNSAQGGVAFLTKPSRGSDIAEAADRFERLIYEQSMTINPADDKFSASSGIALRYKLLPMEWLCADIEAYFSRGLQRRLEIIGNYLSSIRSIQMQPVTIHFRRNVPVDLLALAEQAGELQGILSQKTILDTFPADVVPDKIAELERLQGQRPLDEEI